MFRIRHLDRTRNSPSDFDELKLTASAGVAPLKFLAKIASDMNKPNGQFVIQPHEVEQFVKRLPLKKSLVWAKSPLNVY